MAAQSKPFLLYAVVGVFIAYIIYTRVALYLARRKLKKQHGCQPCPHVINKDPFLGLDMLRINRENAKNCRTLEAVQERFNMFNSDTFRSRIITMPVIVTREPENVKTILSLKFKDYNFGMRKHALAPLLGYGIFNSDGAKWSSSRHMLRPNFAREQVADIQSFERHFKLMLKHIPRDGSTVDLQDLFFKLTIDTSTEFLFNHSTNSLRMMGEEAEHNEDVIFSKKFTFCQEDMLRTLRLGPFGRFRKAEESQEAIRICHAYVDKWVDDAVRWSQKSESEKAADMAKDGDRYIFIHELAKQIKDKRQIRDELMNILLAGRDTTASLLSNMFFEIAKRPDIYAKLREEIAQFNGEIPTYEQLRGLKYLKWCINESLRLHPVVPANSRFAGVDTVLPLGGGPSGNSPLFVPAGTLVSYIPYAMHRRPDYFGPDADIYRPERFETLRPGWEYLPFNGGPRICLGQQYALTEASYITVRMVQEFERCESRDIDGVWVEGLTLTACSKKGTKVGLTPAQASA